jgi:predicted dehydrogenase
MANDRPHVLVVGVGSIGERHLRCFAATGRVRLSICEIRDDLRTRVAREYGVAAAYGSLEAALASPPFAAVIATPAPHHVEAAGRLAAAGSHVLIEKPLGVEETGVAELCRLVEERHLVAAVAYVYRAHPALLQMKEVLDTGVIGRPLELVAVAGQHFPTYRPAYRETYYRDRALGGGAVQDALTHVINAAEWLIGPAERVFADAAHMALEGVEVEDTVHVLARHGAVPACYALNQHQAPNENTITVVGERGTVRFEYHRHRLGCLSTPTGEWDVTDFELPNRDALFVAQAERFVDAALGRGTVACTLREGWQTLRSNLAILAASQSGNWETIAAVDGGIGP